MIHSNHDLSVSTQSCQTFPFPSIFFGASKERANIHVGEAQIKESDEEKLLGITLDKKLSLKTMSKRYVKKLVKSFMLLRAFQSTWSPRN